MIPEIRKQFNDKFSDAAYRQYLEDLEAPYPGALDFRVAETPLFIPAVFRDQMLEACEHIIDVITAPELKQPYPPTILFPTKMGIRNVWYSILVSAKNLRVYSNPD
jgi:hypothetical protein